MRDRGGVELTGTTVLVVGMSRSGVAAAKLARQAGARVLVSEQADTAALQRQAADLRRRGILAELGGHTRDFCAGASLVIVSPGVKPAAEPLQWARQQRIPVYSELEFAGWFCRTPVIAISGSNGKTTVTTLIGALLRAAGLRVVVCGNIGVPWSAVITRCRRADVVVIEVSSFQLEYIRDFHPRVSVLLNISQNHFDHHAGMREYVRAKKNLVRNQTGRDVAVLNYEDRRLRRLAGTIAARPVFFSSRSKPVGRSAAWLTPQDIVLCWREKRLCVPRASLRLGGRHNLENSMAALLAVQMFAPPPAALLSVMRRFSGVEHRCERVMSRDGVLFINDAKSTTVDATARALEMFADGQVILICGGRNKGSDFRPIRAPVARKTAAVVLIGEAAAEISAVLRGAVPLSGKTTLAEAVLAAFNLARPGQVVLFSPMCASFDMFADYNDRGRQYKAVVRALPRRP